MSHAAQSARLRHLEEGARQLLTYSPTVSALLGSELKSLHSSIVGTSTDLRTSKSAFPEKFCKSCGIFQVSGLTCRVRIKRQAFISQQASEHGKVATKKKHASRSKYANKHHEKQVEYFCLHCNRSTYYEIPSTRRQALSSQHSLVTQTAADGPLIGAAEIHAPLQQTAPSIAGDASQETAPSLAQTDERLASASSGESLVKTNASATARARAKARKKTGLAALVAKASATTTLGTRSGNGLNGGLSLMDFMQEE